MADYPRSPVSAAPGQNTLAMTKAQQFEDEKRRIMQSCFSRQDSDGSRAYSLTLTQHYYKPDVDLVTPIITILSQLMPPLLPSHS
jgi:hypothetical protein